MANFCGVTVTDSSIELDKEQQAALDKIMERYCFTMEDYQFGREWEAKDRPETITFGIWGYDWLNIVAKGANGEPDEDSEDISEEFFEDIRKILKPGQTFAVVCVGNEKLRYASGMKVVVTPEKVEWTNI